MSGRESGTLLRWRRRERAEPTIISSLEPLQSEPVPARRRPNAAAVVLIMLCQGSQSLVIGGIALFLPLIRASFGLTFTQAGLISVVSILSYVIVTLPAGFLADRFGPKQLFVVGLLGTNLLALNFAHLHAYDLVLANQVASGAFRALVFAPGLLLISDLFPPNRRATALGLYVAAGFSSNIFLNLLGPALVTPLGWRALFSLFAVLGLVFVAIYYRVTPRHAAAKSRARVPLREGLAVLRRVRLWLLAAIQYVRYALVSSVQTWLPSFIVYDRGHSIAAAGLVVALGSLVSAPANFFGGYISDRLRNPLAVVGGSLAVLSLTTLALARVHSFAWIVVVSVITFLFLQFYFGPLFALPIDMFGSRTAGVTSAFSNVFANIGALTFTFLLGALRDRTGSFAAGFYALSGLALLGLACVGLLAAAESRRA